MILELGGASFRAGARDGILPVMGNSIRLMLMGMVYPLSHTLWIPNSALESPYGVLYVLVVFSASWCLLAQLVDRKWAGRSKQVCAGIAVLGYVVTWMIFGISGGLE
jgi:hypothetical protein